MPTATRAAPSGKTHWIVRFLIMGACALGFLVVAAVSILNFGVVRGIEFSPDTFASRLFVYYELPLVRFRITPVWRDDVSGALQRQLASAKELLPASANSSPRWHLVAMAKGRSPYTDDALIVYRYLQDNSYFTAAMMLGPTDENSAAERWRKWTDDHDELAAILWPAVAEVCRAELYLFTPELFDVAEQMTLPEGTAPGEEEFELAIAGSLARQYTVVADARRAQEKHDEAIELYTAALKHDKNFRAALAGRERSYYEVGESGKSKQDRDRLRELQRGD